jgi:hypothetical protein
MLDSQYLKFIVIDFLALLIGLTLGVFYLNLNYFSVFTNFKSRFSFGLIKKRDEKFRISETKFINIISRLNLFELEKRVLAVLLESDEISVDEFNQLIKLSSYSKQNQRQRRHLFIKELNLKLSLINGSKENILRLDSEIDKRSKLYSLDETVKKEFLRHHFNLFE